MPLCKITNYFTGANCLLLQMDTHYSDEKDYILNTFKIYLTPYADSLCNMTCPPERLLVKMISKSFTHETTFSLVYYSVQSMSHPLFRELSANKHLTQYMWLLNTSLNTKLCSNPVTLTHRLQKLQNIL